MSGLPPSASVATAAADGKLHAPSAARNTAVIVALLRDVAPPQGRALEIASGTGQHAVALATALPHLDWFPTEVAPERLSSIDAYARAARLPNLHAAQHLDATAQGWAGGCTPYDLIHLGNLLHLISQDAALTLLTEASKALTPKGTFIIYGPFMREGILTSEGDAQFDAELRAADPAIGYKDDAWVNEVMTSSGLHPSVRNMPANNLAFIARRTAP
jgi:predicted O-methyltransferase YrrM